jgi:molecular chaperone GrpE
MNKEDKSKKKDTMDDKSAGTEEGMATELSGDKGHSRKDKKHKADANEDIIKQWQVKADELNDKYLRLYSEFDNYRKRTQKERIEFSKTASEEIIVSLLPVIDDLERALALTMKAGDDLEVIPKEGLQLIYQKFKGLLVQKGLENIPAIGEQFDVDFHDAITNIPAPSEDLKGKVVDEVEKGYKLNGKVIRYSKVVVGN